MKKILFAIIAMLTLSSTCRAVNTLPVEGEWVKPSNPLIQYIGRINDSNPDQPTFNWPGIEIRARFQGTSLSFVALSLTRAASSLLLPLCQSAR